MATATTTRTRNNDTNGDVNDDERREDLEVRDARQVGAERARERQNARRYMDYADREGQHAARALVRSMNEAATSLVPRALVRPGAVLRAIFDVMSMALDMQRAMWDELTQVWREDTQRVARTARTDERVDLDREWEDERERIGR